MHQRYSSEPLAKKQWPDEIELYFIFAKGTPWAELKLDRVEMLFRYSYYRIIPLLLIASQAAVFHSLF
jgi:hypothetical protein